MKDSSYLMMEDRLFIWVTLELTIAGECMLGMNYITPWNLTSKRLQPMNSHVKTNQ